MEIVMPCVVFFIIGFGLLKRVNVYDAFIKGAKNGLNTAIAILPSMGAMMVAVALLKESGLMAALVNVLAPVFALVGIDENAAPLMLMRPFSGSASLAILNSIFLTHGADSRAGLTASALMGSTETIFYTLSIYLAAAKVKKGRYAVAAAMLAWLFGGIAAGLFYK